METTGANMADEEFEKEVAKKIDEIYEAEDVETDAQNQTDDVESDGSGNGEEFSADNFDDFLKKTESKVSVKKEGCMPSPIFGNRDSGNHNKYRVYIENPNGKISFLFWDSIKNTEEGKPLDTKAALAAFGNDVSAFEGEPSYEGFKSAFGYEETEENLAQKAYNGCRKQMEKARKLFDDGQLKELRRLASEY